MQQVHEMRGAHFAPMLAPSVRILFLAAPGDQSLLAQLAETGAAVDVETELYTALAAIIDDPKGYGLFVMDCDAHGGAAAGARAVAALAAVEARVRIILIGGDLSGSELPQDRRQPVRLGAPFSGAGLRRGIDHALRDLVWRPYRGG